MASSIYSTAVNWHPSHLLRDREAGTSATEDKFALVILNQPLNDQATLRRLWHNSSLHIAADGGANRLHEVRQGCGDASLDDLHVIIGDLDSLRDDVRKYYTSMQPPTLVIHDPDQYSTDFGKAINYVRTSRHRPSTSNPPGSSSDGLSAKHALDIVAMGGLGGRVDQGLSQLHHLYIFQKDPQHANSRLYLISGESLTFLLKAGRHRIWVREHGADGAERPEELFGKHVGIVPLGSPSIITTSGLEWDVENWETDFGGQISTSNHVRPETEVLDIWTSSDVLFTIALRRDEGGGDGS